MIWNGFNKRFEYVDDFLGVMSNDISDICGAGLNTQETSGGNEEANRGKTAKKTKTKKKNLFEGQGQDRLLQVSLSKRIEAKIDSHYEKIGHLEDKMDKKIGHLEDKMDKKIGHLEDKMDEKIGHLENKIDKLEDLILRLLDATQQKLV